MKSRGIIMSATSVRAIREDRKTQTRRVVTRTRSTVGGSLWPADAWAKLDFDDAPVSRSWMDGAVWHYLNVARPADETRHRVRSRIEPGDELWVKETFSRATGDPCIYRADMTLGQWPTLRWTSPLFMPRALSRLTLRVTSVRVERVQEISDADARAEGATHTAYPPHVHTLSVDGGKTWGKLETTSPGWAMRETTSSEQCLYSARMAYANMWETIHGPWSWRANPWVFVYAFERVRP